MPDSQLKALCNYLMDKYSIDPKHHIIAANEGNNIRVYVPLDLNRRLILRRLSRVINHYKEANEKNEIAFRLMYSNLLPR